MKNYIYIFITFATLFSFRSLAEASGATEWGDVTNNIQMSIRMKSDTNETKLNEPLVLSVRFRNVSTNQSFSIYRANGIEFDPSYSWVVISPSGEDVSPDMKKIHPSISGASLQLKPEQTTELDLDLSRLCTFNKVGIYKVLLKKQVFSPEKQKTFTVVSNPLQIAVNAR